MFKPVTLIIVAILFASGYWFYTNMVTPQGSNIRVTNLPWQITVVDEQTLHVLDMDIGKITLGEAVNILRSEYSLAWFENQDDSISLEAYFIRVSISGLRAKVLLELDAEGLDKNYLLKHSGKPEIQTSRTIKYPLDDLAQELDTRVVHSMTYLPPINLEPQMLESRFGTPEERLKVDENSEFWLYPQKGLVISLSKQSKEVFQYIPVGQFERLQQSIQATIAHARETMVE